MDKRQPLKRGTEIKMGSGAVFTLGDVIGRGGLSLVYSATSNGGMTKSVIKEFYPAMDCAARDNNGHVCCCGEGNERFNAARCLFESEGIIGGEIANRTFQVISFWEYQNGYAAMKRESEDMLSIRTLVQGWETKGPISPSGKIWDKTPAHSDLFRVHYVLTIVDSLLPALSAIHETYLHLDLSSTNIIWACRELSTGSNGVAIISDFGSAAPLDGRGEFHPNYTLFTSNGFAAPEIYRRNHPLDRKTDLYSVGMLLIYLCIGEDRFARDFANGVGAKTPWQLARDIGNIDLDIPNFLGKGLFEILMHVLVNREYGSTTSMQSAIQELRNKARVYIADQETSLVSVGQKIQGTPSDEYYVYREEINGIVGRLQRNVNPIIAGIGGIGKTALARRFAKEYGGGNPYFVSFINFAGSFRKTIASLGNLHFNDREEVQKSLDDQFADGLALLRSCSSNYVLIIDNVDTKTDLRSDEDFHYLQEMDMHFIFTTRNETGRECDETIYLDRMDEDSCLKLMKSYLDDYGNGEHDEVLRSIIEQINGHTLTCELLAKTLRDSFGLTPEAVLASLRGSKLDDERWCEIQTAYDLAYIPRTVLAHLRTAFHLGALSDESKRILGSLCMAEYGLTKQHIEHLFSADEWKTIQEAKYRGWLMCRNECIEWDDYPTKECDEPIHRSASKVVYILHPVIRAVCLLDPAVKPSWSNSKPFIQSYISTFSAYSGPFENTIDVVWDPYPFVKYRKVFVEMLEMGDFETMMQEEPDCAGMIYMELMNYIEAIDAVHTPQSRESVYYYGRKVINYMRRESPVYYDMLRTLCAFCSPLWKFELSRALRYWKLMLRPKVGKFVRHMIDDKEHANVSTEVDWTDLLCFARLSDKLNNTQNALKYASMAYQKRLGTDSAAFFPFWGALLQYWFALFHSQKYNDALQLLGENLRELEQTESVLRWAAPPIDGCSENNADLKLEDWKKLITSHGQTTFSQQDAFLVDILADSCELQYWAAQKGGQRNLAEMYKKKYVYYMSLLSCYTATSLGPDEKLLAEWQGWLAEHPFIPPVVDASVFDENQGFPPCARNVM